MKDIKTRENKKDIKMLDRAAVLAKVTKNATVRTKDQVQNLSDDGQITPDEYAEDKVKYMAESAIEDTGKVAKKTVQKTYDGGKRLYKERRRTRKETDAIKQTAKSTGKSTAKTLQKSIKTGQRTVKTAQQTARTTVKTAEKTAKAAKKTAEATAKSSKMAAQAARQAAQATYKVTVVTAKAVAAAVKSAIAGIKALAAAIAAGGFVSVVINVKEFGSEFLGGIVTSSKNDLDNDENRIAVFGTTDSNITYSANGEWTEIKRTFNSGENTALRLMFIIKASEEKDTTVYIDDIVIEEYDKVTPETPAAPEIVSHTASSVTLKETMGMEYSMDGVNYSASPTFTGLFGGTEYSFYQRTVEDELNLPSEKSEPVKCILTVNGDADANGTLEAMDIAIVKKVLLNVNTDYSSDGCDANGDGKIDIRDLVALKKTHALLSTTSFIMLSRNITDYNIVYSGSSETVQNAIMVLNNAVKARVNSELTVLTENTESPAIKLVVNATDYKDSFNIEFVNNDLVITAGDDDYIVSALNTLAKRISEYPQDQTLIITRSYNHSSD